MIDGRRGPRGAEQSGTTDKAPLHRPWYRRVRLGARLAALGVTANMVTVAGVVVSLATAALLALGQFHVALVCFIVAGLMDSLDGAVAKARNASSRQGAFLDSVADRVSDGVLLLGITWYLAAGHDPRVALLPVGVLLVSAVVSYERAKAESLGLSAKGGLMERAERMILLALGILLPFILVPVLWALLVLTTGTAVGRFARVWRQAGGTPAGTGLGEAIWRTGRVESRFRAWREQGALAGGVATFGTWPGRRRAPRATRRREERRPQTAGGAARRGAPGRARSARALRRRLDGPR